MDTDKGEGEVWLAPRVYGVGCMGEFGECGELGECGDERWC